MRLQCVLWTYLDGWLLLSLHSFTLSSVNSGVPVLYSAGKLSKLLVIRYFFDWRTRRCYLQESLLFAIYIASLFAAVALYLGSYLFHSPVFYWIVAALSLTIITDLCFMLLLEFITRSHTSKCVREKGEGGEGGRGRVEREEGRGWRGRKGEREMEGEQFNRTSLS